VLFMTYKNEGSDRRPDLFGLRGVISSADVSPLLSHRMNIDDKVIKSIFIPRAGMGQSPPDVTPSPW